MIVVEYECVTCKRKLRITLSGDTVYNRARIKDTHPYGWTIRTPRNGIAAMSYCPEHGDGPNSRPS